MTRMNCGEVRDLLQPFDDGELPAGELRAVNDHLKGCPECARALAELRKLRANIRASGTFAMPDGLAGRVEAAIGLDKRHTGSRSRGRLAALAASHLVVAALAAGAAHYLGARASWQTGATGDLVAAHVRSLMADQVVQVASSDTHTVRPWFNGRVSYAPSVIDLSSHGYPLLGGRTDYVIGNKVAVLVYGRRKHRIDVFVLPIDRLPGRARLASSRDGYQVLGWQAGTFAYLAVSDLNARELDELAAHLRREGDR